jgi:hypothetical protein
MKSNAFTCVAGCWFAAFLFVHPLSGATNVVTGILTNHATWSGTNLVQGTVTVTNGVVLTLTPGARVLMNTGATLVVRGQLQALGTASEPIYFTRRVAGQRWKQIVFAAAQPSRFQHCVIEYADCVGDHKDYYPTNCQPPLFAPRRYHEAVVALGSHVDFESCVFRNLPDDASGAEGDALAIVSDDPTYPGTAAANVRQCQFLSIGQGVHTRYSYVLVENCYFYGHSGDNDDVDLYGESTPPPMVRSNLFLNAQDDFINPTRCSALIIGNVFAGSTDHGVVLRDRCFPIVMNNVISNCNSGGIAIQNQCDALLINNTILNCSRGLRLFDHTDRRGPPYCLAPGSGKATVVNCVIWNCPTSFLLTDSPHPDDRGSHVTVSYSDVQGGTTNASISANSTLTWGPGNLAVNPSITNVFRLRPGSPCIDTGTNPNVFLTNGSVTLNQDHDGRPRPLDGNGDGVPGFDMGASEFLLASADSNGDGIPDGWCDRYGLNPIDPLVASGNPDQDPHTTLQEWVADTDPTDARSHLRIVAITNRPPWLVSLAAASNRLYTLQASTNLGGSIWTPVPGQSVSPPRSGPLVLTDTNPAPAKFYRLEVKLP